MGRYDPENKKLHETAERLIDREVHLCVSGVVEKLLEVAETENWSLIEERHDAVWESAKPCRECQYCIEAEDQGADPKQVCEDVIHPEVYEWWAVSSWLAHRLKDQGEVVLKDCYGMIVWGRTCSGQSMILDGIFQDIAEDLLR